MNADRPSHIPSGYCLSSKAPTSAPTQCESFAHLQPLF